jgi:hypothetical protein
MHGNDLLSYDMMRAHQRRLLDEAARLHLAERAARTEHATSDSRSGVGSKAGAGAGIGSRAASRAGTRSAAEVGATVGPHVRAAGTRAAGSLPPRPGDQRYGMRARAARRGLRLRGLAGRVGASLVSLGTRLQRLEQRPDQAPRRK